MPFKANADRRHHIPKQRHWVTNSAAYDAALRQLEGLVSCITALLGLDLAVPDYTTLSRRVEMLDAVGPRPAAVPCTGWWTARG